MQYIYNILHSVDTVTCFPIDRYFGYLQFFFISNNNVDKTLHLCGKTVLNYTVLVLKDPTKLPVSFQYQQ